MKQNSYGCAGAHLSGKIICNIFLPVQTHGPCKLVEGEKKNINLLFTGRKVRVLGMIEQ